jgi:hypothetical protein
MRSDKALRASADSQLQDMDTECLGTILNSNNKKARGLMRAGGEAARHFYVDWPHDFVLEGIDNQRIFYKDLTIEQWAYGFVAIIEKETNYIIKNNMISHLKNTFMDTILYGFRRAKGVHGKILTDIEDGRLSWLEGDKISETRRTHVQRPMTLQDYKGHCEEQMGGYYDRHDNSVRRGDSDRNRRYSPKRNKKTTHKICRFFNESRCNFDTDHRQGNTAWQHICSQCKQNHRVTECRKEDFSKK